MNRVRAIRELGQQIWLDDLSRGLIESGELNRLIGEDGLAGVTSNPAIFRQAILKDPRYIDAKAALPASLTDPEARFEALALPDIQAACDAFLPLYQASQGDMGYVSFEVSPSLAHDAAGTVVAAKRLWQTIDRPNVMIKIPATAAGCQAITETLAAGINVNVTLMFSPEHVEQVFAAYVAGLQARVAAGLPVDHLRSVASVFISRVDTKIDAQLPDSAAQLKGKLAVASAQVAYQTWRQHFDPQGSFKALHEQGARPQSLLWASTGTKNPAYSDVLYVETLIGPDTVNTVPGATLAAFRDHGQAARTLDADPDRAQQWVTDAAAIGIDLNAVGRVLQDEGLKLFEQAFAELLAAV
ncbi:transaldolase [Chitinivorax tropicus]|uniref:Transaldolase n=1 Tax=Chitinivorax tropicus TaxID=714531 RepID=A0A840MKD0_9PROT|nr:transaldolase [Chitinivorax tropicus]MBB5017162.1 transaldolase [Chitinivorax tropicus]